MLLLLLLLQNTSSTNFSVLLLLLLLLLLLQSNAQTENHSCVFVSGLCIVYSVSFGWRWSWQGVIQIGTLPSETPFALQTAFQHCITDDISS